MKRSFEGPPGPLHTEASAGGSRPESTGSPATVEKVIVAVHGIGDQPNYGTIQAVVNQFCTFFGQAAGVPLGAFNDAKSAFRVGSPHADKVFERFAFSEVYWATFPRELVDDKHKLEESKAWAQTIVERLRLRHAVEQEQKRAAKAPSGSDFVVPKRPPDFALVKQVLAEMINALAVLDRLFFLAEKAGLFSFDLRRVLDDYLGDVQVVAEFGQERAKILGAFSDTMVKVWKDLPDAEIYIVAHSEGTVVAFLGLLEGFRQRALPPWTANVRGLMTLGSPIDKHLVLWPELFGKGGPHKSVTGRPPIKWRNYYDYGDPVGFELDGARSWINDNGWDRVFEFSSDDRDKHDIGFTRYPFPGKAHVDYWTDKHVFGHFLQTVVGEEPAKVDGKKPDFSQPPKTRIGPKLLSYVIPYPTVLGVLIVASYVLLKSLLAVAHPSTAEDISGWAIAGRASGLGVLLFGITVVARVPRLTRRLSWRIGAITVALLCAFIFAFSVAATQQAITGQSAGRDLTTLWLAIATAASVCAISIVRPEWGLKPLLAVAAPLTVLRIALVVLDAKRGDAPIGPLWPLVLAVLAFIYLWWLAALFFDLVILWHLYIRDFNVRKTMDQLTGTWVSRSPPRS